MNSTEYPDSVWPRDSVRPEGPVSPAFPAAAASARTPDSRPPLTLALSTLGILFAEGVSLGLFLWAVSSGPKVVRYVLDNQLSGVERLRLLITQFGMGALFALAGCAYLTFAATPSLVRINAVARRLCPVILIGFVPFLFNWQLWQSRELTYCVMVGVLSFAVHATSTAFLLAPPLFPNWRVRAAQSLPRLALRLEPHLPLILVLLGVVSYSLHFSYHTIQNHYNLRSASLDLGLEENLLWNLIHGGQFMKSSPLVGPTGSHFGYHATLFAYILGPIYAIYQHAETLLVIQSVMLGAGALPLFLIGRRYIGAWSACLFAFVYLLYPPLHGANLYDFHYLPLGIFFLWLTVFLVESGRTRWAVLSVLVTLSIREDVAAGLGILGAYLLLSGRRPLAGLVLAIVGVTYFVVMKLVIMPLKLGDDSFVYMFKDLLPKGETGFSGVLKTVFSNPVFTLNSLLTQEKLLYVVQLAVPLAFIPWRRPIGWLCTLPGFFFTLLSTGYSPLVQISFQYTANWISFIFIAGLANLAFVGKAAFPGDVLGPVRRRSWMMTIAAMTLCTSYQYGAIMQLNTARGGFGPYIFGSTKQDQTNYAKLKRLIRRVPPNAKIVSSENIVPHIANRADSYTMRIGAFDAEYLLGMLPANLDEARTMKQALDGGFGVVEIDMPFVLARRGYPKDRNIEVMQHIHP